MSLRKLPESKAENLASLIEIKPHQVVSMSISQNDNANITLLAFADGEDLSEEVYLHDIAYYVLQGQMTVVFEDTSVTVEEGQIVKVPAGKSHRLSAHKAFKMMQISL